MSSHILISSLEYNQKTLDSLLAGVTQSDTMAVVHQNVQHIHWVVGHIASQRDTLLEDLTGEMTFPQDMKPYYDQAKYTGKSAGLIDWQKCLAILKEQHTDISAWVLEWDSQGRLNQEKGDTIVGYLNHEAFCIGQIDLIKRMLPI